ncbi:unnamed protein product, partial [Toxocara canis]|uniref:CA domain-containing protein n=1 Tax=Toxocara canis TaxID=6265 RepID=A0A183VEU4_TOXCA
MSFDLKITTTRVAPIKNAATTEYSFLSSTESATIVVPTVEESVANAESLSNDETISPSVTASAHAIETSSSREATFSTKMAITTALNTAKVTPSESDENLDREKPSKTTEVTVPVMVSSASESDEPHERIGDTVKANDASESDEPQEVAFAVKTKEGANHEMDGAIAELEELSEDASTLAEEIFESTEQPSQNSSPADIETTTATERADIEETSIREDDKEVMTVVKEELTEDIMKQIAIEDPLDMSLAVQEVAHEHETTPSIVMPRRGGLVVSEGLHDGEIVPDFEIIVTAKDMNPRDVIVLSVNSTAFDVVPRRMQPGKTVFLAIRDSIAASLRSQASIAVSRSILIVKEDASDTAPRFLSSDYDFHASESTITGQKVGQMEVEDADERDHGLLNFRLIGPGIPHAQIVAVHSNLISFPRFTVSGGTISVACPTALPCLDREETDSYHLLAVATDQGGLNSAPASVRIFIDDRNDNGPSIHLTQNEIRISDGKFVRPFAVKIRDPDTAPFNVNDVSTDGNASTFISLERIHNDLYMARLSSLPTAGNYQLEIIARDPAGLNPPNMALVDVNVLNTITKAHFKRPRYERTVNSEKLHKGNPLVQPEFEGAPIENVRFVTLRDDPGWLMIDEYSGNVFVGDVPR